jgi:hypothetical protein
MTTIRRWKDLLLIIPHIRHLMGVDQNADMADQRRPRRHQELVVRRRLLTRSIPGLPKLGRVVVLLRLARHGPEKNTTGSDRKRKRLRPVKSTGKKGTGRRTRHIFPSPILLNA